MVVSTYTLFLAITVASLLGSGCAPETNAPKIASASSVQGRLILPPGLGSRGIQVIGTVRLDEGDTFDQWLILNEDGRFTHNYRGELIGLRITSGIEADITSFDDDDLPEPDRSGQIDLGNIDVRNDVVEHALRLQLGEGTNPGSIRIGMWFGEPSDGVSLGSRQFPVVELGSTVHWLLPHDADDIYFLIEHPSNPDASADAWRGGAQQRFGPYNSEDFPAALVISPRG